MISKALGILLLVFFSGFMLSYPLDVIEVRYWFATIIVVLVIALGMAQTIFWAHYAPLKKEEDESLA